MNESLEKIIKNSGNYLHLHIVELLEKCDWKVDLSSYYYDDTNDKPREIDIVASKTIELKSFSSQNLTIAPEGFKLILFIECKYFKEEIAFHMRDYEGVDQARSIIVERMNKGEVLTDINNNHHYFNFKKIGKLYDCQISKDVFDAITQPIKSLTFFKARNLEMGFYYPVVVFSGIDGIYQLETNDASDLQSIKSKKVVPFGVNYSYRSPISDTLETQLFNVDFVEESMLEGYLNTIEFNAKEFEKAMSFRKIK
jgi:hypothetical protein